jgi:aspartate/methionine/tyrosine aminotransferase
MTPTSFRNFLMEDALEEGRFQARFNAGESGGPPQNLAQIISQIPGVSAENASRTLLEMPLHDSPNHGRADLRAAIASLHPGALPNNVLVTTGTSEALFLYFYLRPPKKIALILPGFQLLYELAHVHHSTIVPLPMRWSPTGHPQPDLSAWLDTLAKEKPDLVLINHPHNPSGWVPQKEFLEEVQALVESWSGTVLGDEHYRFLVDTGHSPHPQSVAAQADPFPMGATLFRDDERSVVTGSFIKCLGTPGLRIGWCVGPSALIRQMQNLKNYTTHTVNPYSEWIASLVLTDPTRSAFHCARNTWIQNCTTFANWMASTGEKHAGWTGAAPKGGWVTCLARTGWTDSNRLKAELRNHGVFLLGLDLMEWSAFDQDSLFSRWASFRVGFGVTPQLFAEMLQVLSTI